MTWHRDTAKWERIAELRAQGYSAVRIGKEIGMAESAVRYVVKKQRRSSQPLNDRDYSANRLMWMEWLAYRVSKRKTRYSL